MKRHSRFLSLTGLFLLSTLAFSQEDVPQWDEDDSNLRGNPIAAPTATVSEEEKKKANQEAEARRQAEEAEAEAKKKAEEALKKAEERRRDILLYGITDQVLEAIKGLREDKIGSYNSVLEQVLQDAEEFALVTAIFGLWEATQYQEGLPIARAHLQDVLDDEDYDKDTLLAAFSYVSASKDRDSQELLVQLSENRDTTIAAAAVRALGTLGPPLSDEAILSLLDRLDEIDPLTEDDLTASLITSLGELQANAAANTLLGIAEDEGANAGHRRLACVAVGRIGREEDFEPISRIYFDSDDATLRSYALGGLALFPNQDNTRILAQALRRDSFWRIRVTAAENLMGVKTGDIPALLRFKAVHDPIPQVQKAAMASLAPQASSESREFMLQYFGDETNSTELRIATLKTLAENRIDGTIDAVRPVMDKLWEKDEGRFLEYTCRELASIEWPALAPLFERMLDHQNWLVQVYGIRGIRRNSLSTLEPKIQGLDRDGVDGRTRREISSGN
ncbi:MAG: HEAT repeat domain-containing protein [Spirochaetales bacterium]|nr:HEAT repeat domain-containing protein [Spirochaetales bacterium]